MWIVRGWDMVKSGGLGSKNFIFFFFFFKFGVGKRSCGSLKKRFRSSIEKNKLNHVLFLCLSQGYVNHFRGSCHLVAGLRLLYMFLFAPFCCTYFVLCDFLNHFSKVHKQGQA